ncbi:similar to Saccharomyces cerevisiae YKR023W Putative protein of unknown function [Maudiozyma barnettii]|uniref:TRIP4/RQT4 C2HC5-type zinc finger domain-containing protein n=1 Tax=Maudiozyma barnettii TaxID=61262 RepID=A0A8H2ZI45_9SACH|nr:Rqt4p [Kazachstania barnettii]CAB4254583.1 similar to Saccharomyces cerevisiae YKR023W Putative protein of unknown function [Kazachstania barnettii]CAD1782625.1 similar to Saccharomyces cerevisiae YKR023W Putative protein of unknown function [Kazachstania barnettii]
MTKVEALNYAVETIPQILPLEKQDVIDLCNQIITTNKTPDSIAEGFMNILGQEEMVFDFIFKFNELLEQDDSKKIQTGSTKKEAVIENTEKTIPASKDNAPPPLIKVQPKHVANITLETPKSSIPNKETTATLKNKQSNSSGKKTGKQKKLQSLEEINEAVKLLDLNEKKTNSKEYACSCQGRIHPLFELAPNCLSCGKLICVKEGLNLNNCSFCEAELIPFNERYELIQELNKEKDDIISGKNGQLEKETTTAKRKPTKVYKISSGMGKNLFKEQDKLFDFIERQHERERKRDEVMKKLDDLPKEIEPQQKVKVDEELEKAQNRLENLLHFQDTSAERTKIIDNASDFDMSGDASMWGSSKERAMLLKKQQRNLRKWEKMERERHGKSDKYVLNMNIGANGKVTMTEVEKDHGDVYANSDEDLDNISDDEDRADLHHIRTSKQQLQQEKDVDNLVLQSNVWDYEKDKKQFKKPIYVDSNTNEPAPIESNDSQVNRLLAKESRVQIASNNDSALEDNILAVL